MTKQSIFVNFLLVGILIILLLFSGILISIFDSTTNRNIFSTFRDLIPLFLGFIAAWLSYCIQRRSSFLQQLRIVWSKMVESVQYTIQYTTLNNPNHSQFIEVLTKLSIAIDEIRGVFKNIEEKKSDTGLYPFEPLKDIYGLINDLNYDINFRKEKAAEIRDKIFILWKELRKEILKEFDREIPSFPHSHWIDFDKQKIYDTHNIPKRPT